MSTNVKTNLEQQRTTLLLQRSGAKDQIEQLDQVIGQITFALRAIEEASPADGETPEE